jgi:hypothetical protein
MTKVYALFVSWPRYLKGLLGLAFGVPLALFAFVALVDPYDVVPFSPPMARPPMDLNQRFMFPAIVRRGGYDSAVFGTSTARLFEPVRLNAALGGRWANLAMNAATAYEQYRLADLYLRHTPAPRAVLFGLDAPWCSGTADTDRFTFRPFPPWMYDDNRWNDLLYLLNGKAVEIAGRLVGHHLGLMPQRLGWDGYERFVPPEASYDAARARGHIYAETSGRIETRDPPEPVSDAMRASWRFPALGWLNDLLARLPPETVRLIVFTPVHRIAQPVAGSAAAAQEAECKRQVAQIAVRHKATVIDFRIDSEITRTDTNYWDRLHFRVPVAERVVGSIAAAATGAAATDGSYDVIVRP